MIGKVRKADPVQLNLFLERIELEEFGSLEIEQLKTEIRKIVPEYYFEPSFERLEQYQYQVQ